MLSCWKEKKQKITTIINISHYSYLKKKKKKDRMELNHEKCQCEWGKLRGGFVWCCHGLKGQGSGLLAAPLALCGPPEELLYMPCHIHGVVQVKLSVRVQHRVTPVTGHRVEPDHTQTSRQHITKETSSSTKTQKCQKAPVNGPSTDLLYLYHCMCVLSLLHEHIHNVFPFISIILFPTMAAAPSLKLSLG